MNMFNRFEDFSQEFIEENYKINWNRIRNLYLEFERKQNLIVIQYLWRDFGKSLKKLVDLKNKERFLQKNNN